MNSLTVIALLAIPFIWLVVPSFLIVSWIAVTSAMYYETGQVKASARVAFNVVLPYLLAYLVVALCAATGIVPVIIGLVALFIAWHALPHIYIHTLCKGLIPKEDIAKAHMDFLKSAVSGVIPQLMSIVARFIVPWVVLLFVDVKKDNKLPGILDDLFNDPDGMFSDTLKKYTIDVLGWSKDDYFPAEDNSVLTDEVRKELMSQDTYLPGVWFRTKTYVIMWLLRRRASKVRAKVGPKVEYFTSWKCWGEQGRVGAGVNSKLGQQALFYSGRYELKKVFYVFKFFGLWPVAGVIHYGWELSECVGPVKDTEDPTYKDRPGRAMVINNSFSLRAYKGTEVK